MDLLLRLLWHFLEALYQSVALGLAAQASEGEADIPFSGQVVEGQHFILGDGASCDHGGAVLVDPKVVVAALVVQKLAV